MDDNKHLIHKVNDKLSVSEEGLLVYEINGHPFDGEMTTFIPPQSGYNMVFSNENGDEVGRFEWTTGEVVFTGNIDKSAKVFFDFLKPLTDQYIKQIRATRAESALREIATLAGADMAAKEPRARMEEYAAKLDLIYAIASNADKKGD